MLPTSTLRTVALVAGCLDQRLPLAQLRAPADGPVWTFAGDIRRDRICTRPVSGRDRGPITFGATRPDGVVWLFDTLADTHLLLRPCRRGTWQLLDPAHRARGSVHTAPALVAVHQGPDRTDGRAEAPAGFCSVVYGLVARPASHAVEVPPAALRQHRAALLGQTPALTAAA